MCNDSKRRYKRRAEVCRGERCQTYRASVRGQYSSAHADAWRSPRSSLDVLALRATDAAPAAHAHEPNAPDRAATRTAANVP